MSTITDIADAAVVMLNDASLVQTFTALRHYQPRLDKKDNDSLIVSVAPASWTGTLADRSGKNDSIFGIDIGIQKLFSASTRATINDELDPLMTFVEAAVNLFLGVPIGNTNATCVEFENAPIYSVEHFDKDEFLSVVNLGIRKFV